MKMRRIVGVFFMCVCSIMYAQKVEKVKEISLAKHSYNGLDESNLLMKQKDVLYFFRKTPRGVKSIVGGKEFKKNKCVIIKVTSSGEEVIKGVDLVMGNTQYEFVSVIRKNHSLFVLGQSKNLNKYELCLFTIDQNTFEISKREVVVSDKGETNSQDNYVGVYVKNSKDLKKTFIATKRYANFKIGVYLQDLLILGEDGSVVQTTRLKGKHSNVEGIEISNDGEMFAYGARMIGDKKGGQLFFYKYNKSGVVEDFIYQIPKGIVLQINRTGITRGSNEWADAKYGAINVINNHLMYDVPYYSMAEGKDVGVLTVDIEVGNFSNGHVLRNKYEENVIGGLLKMYSYKDIHRLVPNNLNSIVLKDGARIIVGDLVYTLRSTESDYYVASNIVIMKISAKGEVMWSKFVPRKMIRHSKRAWMEIKTVNNDGVVNVFLNDYPPNDLLSGYPVKENNMSKIHEIILKQLTIDGETGSMKQYNLGTQAEIPVNANVNALEQSILLENNIIMVSFPYHNATPLLTFYKFK